MIFLIITFYYLGNGKTGEIFCDTECKTIHRVPKSLKRAIKIKN